MNSIPLPKSQKIRLVNPNLGHPQFIRIEKNEQQIIECRLLFVSNIQDKAKIRETLKGKLSAVPIIEYKWKLQRMLEEERKRKQTLWGRIKNFFKRKSQKEKEITSKLSELQPRGFRADPIPLSMSSIEEQPELNIKENAFLEDQYCNPQSYLRKWNIFDNLKQYFCVDVSFSLPKEIQDYFLQRPFIMFDIKGVFQQTNYHSLILTKKNWQDFIFIQITDLHLAERNDKIFEIVSKWEPTSALKKTKNYIEKVANKIKSVFTGDFGQDKGEQQEAKALKKSFEKRFINPNNQLRKLIKIVNRKVLQDEVDFVVLTGDIVDYVIKSKYAGMKIDSDRLKFRHTNWKTFQDIILNTYSGQKYKGQVEEGQELLCPLFTIVGNHDFRTHHYDLTWANLYKKLGLTSSEASALNELYSASPITSLNKSRLGLKFYLQEINPLLDFSLALGDIELIFLNSGADSFKNFKDFLSGHPSVTGLTTDQIRYLENISKTSNFHEKEVLLLIHGPPINIGKYKYFRQRLQAIGKFKVRKKIGHFKESILKKLGKEEDTRRIDKSFNVKRGTVSSNWEQLIQFCKNHTTLTLSGHTHILKEFRLGDAIEKSTVYDAPPFILQKLKNPAAVYYDIYSEHDDSASKIEKDGPLIVQTPALGLGNYKRPEIVGAYREVKIKKGKLSSFKVKYL